MQAKKNKKESLLNKQDTLHIKVSIIWDTSRHYTLQQGNRRPVYCGLLAATVCFLLMVNYPKHGQKLPQYLLLLHLNQTFEYLLSDIL